MSLNNEQFLKITENPSRGEVTTNVLLVRDMLDQLPESIFISSKTTFLDPCFGTGTFLQEIARRLFKYGHSKENIESRIFGVEKSLIYYKKFKQLKGFNPTLIRADFLKHNFENMKFDLIIGNPPYNGGASKNRPIYHIFTKHSLPLLTDIGSIIMITPCLWMSSNKPYFGEYRSFLKTNGLELITIKPNTSFGSEVNIGEFSIIKVTPSLKNNNIVIVKDNKQFNILRDNSNEKIIYEGGDTIALFNKILMEMESNGWSKFNVNRGKIHNIPKKYEPEVFTNRHNISISKSKSQIFPNPILDTGNRITYTQYNDVTSLNKKIWFPMRGSVSKVANKIRYDEGGNVLSQAIVYLEVTDKTYGEFIIKYLNTPLSQFMIKYVKGGDNNNVLNNLRQLYIPNSPQDLNLINLTPEEIQLIEDTIK
jgi:hypothetical protein